jgi:hypothetical protein
MYSLSQKKDQKSSQKNFRPKTRVFVVILNLIERVKGEKIQFLETRIDTNLIIILITKL